MFGRTHALTAIALCVAMTAVPAEAVQRAFVASFGSDANVATSCGFTNPCRGFMAALGVTDPGGEIVALDAAGYGAVTITKSVTITSNPGFYAGISASTGNAVTIATAGINVILRGLNINGIGATNGVSMTNGNKLSIENCVISNFTGGSGVRVATGAKVRIVDSLIRENYEGVYLVDGPTASISGTKLLGNAYHGVYVLGNTTGTTTTAAVSDSVVSLGLVGLEVGANAGAIAQASITSSSITNNGDGIASDGFAGTQTVTVSNSLVTGNTSYGLRSFGGTLESLGNNTVRQNGANTSGTITVVPGV